MIDLSIIIVSWNVRELLGQCLASINASRDSLALETLVVDSGSTDSSVEMVADEFPWVRLLPQPENVGFSRGSNVGLALATGRFLLLLNPDTQLVGPALSQMVAYLDAHPAVGALGPQLLHTDGRIQSSRRRFPTLLTAFCESTWLEGYAPRRLLERYYALDQPDDAVQDVDWVTGAAMMAQREAIAQVGPMDAGFFMYSEELDWCRRFRKAGWRVVYLPTAQIVHHEGKSSEQVVTARHIHFQTSKVRYFGKHHGRLTAELLRFFLLATYVCQTVEEGLKWLVGHKRPLRAARVRAYGQVLRSRLLPGDDSR